MLFDACITFYGTVYASGRFLYRLLHRHADAAELRRWSTWHLRILNLLGGAWLLTSAQISWSSFGILRPSAAIGLLLVVWAAYDLFTTLHRRLSRPIAGA